MPVNLLIVESPGKLKTLRKILGRGWMLEASVGHTTELAMDGYKNLGFDITPGRVATRYQARGSRGKQVLTKLRAAVKKADQVYLAMDPDREGEAIAWHLVQQLKLKNYKRVAYSQITENAVKAAIRSPRQIDFPLVEAQRARQCLDKLVGFEVSPLLWKTSGGKSAGRVQSASLHLVCEREREREAFVPKDYWTLHSDYTEGFTAQYEPPKKQKDEDAKVESLEEAKRIEEIARTNPHIVARIDKRDDFRKPLPPLITSSLQQTAGVRFKYPPAKTMKIAQELYEGVSGHSGLITYMRTDQITLSPEFIQEARTWLSQNVPEALAEKPPYFRAKADAQGAHEAIRPTSVAMTPKTASSFLNKEQLNVYKLIWDRAMASQCKPAKIAKTQVTVRCANTSWMARGQQIIDPGYLKFWQNTEGDKILPQLKEGQKLNLKNVKTEKKSTQPPPRYSEAKLIQLMEKLGIGRPSTYASTVQTLKERDYVVVESGALAPTKLGMSTDRILGIALPDLVDIRFTADMEKSLDDIAESKIQWEGFLSQWNQSYLGPAITQAQKRIQEIPRASIYFEAQNPRAKKKFKKKSSGAKKAYKKKSYTKRAKKGGSSASLR